MKGGHYGAGVGVILLDNVACSGSEQNLLQCSHRGVGVVSTCDHSKDVGVICKKQGNATIQQSIGFDAIHWPACLILLQALQVTCTTKIYTHCS